MSSSFPSVLHEAVDAARLLTRRPLFSGLGIALLALSIATITTLFAVVNVAMLQPLPFHEPESLVFATGTEPTGPGATINMTLGYIQFARWRSDSTAFAALEGSSPVTIKFLGGESPEPVPGAIVSAGYFDALGWKPEKGRVFRREEELPKSGVVIISHGLWQRRFGSDPSIVGKVVNIDEEPREIIGVMPAAFPTVLQPADAWLPLPLGPQQQAMKARLIQAVGRLKPGVTPQQGASDLDRINTALGVERPDEYRRTRAKVQPLREFIFGQQRPTLLALLAAGFVLLIVATVNVTSLAFGDAIGRQMTTMIRTAFGAERRHIIRLRLFEFGVIGTVGWMLGVALAWLSLRALSAAAPDVMAGFRGVSITWSVVLVAAAVSAIAAAIAGVPTALHEAGFNLSGIAGAAAKSIGSRQERRRRDGLLVAQVGMAVVLLVGAVLLARNVRELLSRPTGFQAEGVSVVELTFSPSTYATTEARSQHAQQLLNAVKAVPGVSAAATIQTRFVLNETMQTLFEIEGRPAPTGAQRFVGIRHVTPEVGEVLGLRLRQGRMFAESDRLDTQPVAIVSTRFAATYLPGQNAIGTRIRRVVTLPAPWMEIVGVVDDLKDAGVGVDLGPQLFVSYVQQNTPSARPTIVVRSALPPATLFPSLRGAIWSVDRNQAIDSIAPLEQLVLRSAAQPRFAALVASLLAFSALALVLAGIYSVTLHGVLRQTREIGLRMALGAKPIAVLWAIVRRSVIPTVLGVALGLVGCVPTVSWLGPLLAQGMSVQDIPLLAAALVSIVVASMIASLIPARRALAVSPSITLRDVG
jgi:putative ABC transport system permease protein